MIEWMDEQREREKWIDGLCHNDVIFVLQGILSGSLCMV